MANNIPENLRYSKDHEWVKVDGDIATIGITDYAQHSLGDVVYVDLPRAGDSFGTHEAFGSVESVKAVSEIFTPVAGEVTEVNEPLNDTPENVNNDPYAEEFWENTCIEGNFDNVLEIKNLGFKWFNPIIP